MSESAESNADRLDRQEVIKNTRLNAQLASESSKGDKIRAKIAEAKSHQSDDDGNESHGEKPSDHLQWDEVNLYKTEQEKCATMKIDEPKTPYEGGFNPEENTTRMMRTRFQTLNWEVENTIILRTRGRRSMVVR